MLKITSIYLTFAGFCSAATLTHDALHRLSAVDYADGTRIEYPYDAAGNPMTPIITRPVTLTLLIDPPNSGSTIGAGRYAKDTTQALTATPGSAFDFAGWYRTDGTLLSTDANYNHPITATETVTARFTRIPAPVITTQPHGGQITGGGAITLTVTVTGRDPLNYVWRRNGTPLTNTTDIFYRETSTFLDAGTYTVDITNPGGTTTSQFTLITVPIPNYTTWRNAIFTPTEIAANDASFISPTGFSAHDGMNNLMHFAFGSRSRDKAPDGSFVIGTEASPPGIAFSYNRLLGGGGLAYKVATSQNLISWDESESNLEQVGTATLNPDGLTERVALKLKQGNARSFFRLSVSENQSPILLALTTSLNYSDVTGFGIPEIRSTVPIAGQFEDSPSGVLFKSNRSRGSGSVFTKDNFVLSGKTVEWIWSGTGGSTFDQIVGGAFLGDWIYDSGATQNYFLFGEYGNIYAAPLLLSPSIVYRTRVVFTNTSATLMTYNSTTGALLNTQTNAGNFTTPQHIFLRHSDNYDNTNSFLKLHSLILYP